jgi:hypothetical protein
MTARGRDPSGPANGRPPCDTMLIEVDVTGHALALETAGE